MGRKRQVWLELEKDIGEKKVKGYGKEEIGVAGIRERYR